MWLLLSTMCAVWSEINYFNRILRHSCRRWRSNNAVLPAPQTRILSGSRTIRPGSVSPWELRRQKSVLLRAIFCRIQKLHRCGTEHSLVTDPLCLQFVCYISFFLSSLFFANSPFIPCVNLHLVAAIFETNFQLVTLATLHLREYWPLLHFPTSIAIFGNTGRRTDEC